MTTTHEHRRRSAVNDNSHFEGNANALSGGGIRSSGKLDVERCTLIGNSGGAIFHSDLDN